MTTWTAKLAAARSRRRTKAALAAVERAAQEIARDWDDVDMHIGYLCDQLRDQAEACCAEIDEAVAERLRMERRDAEAGP